MSYEILTPETVKQLRDAGPKDLLWLICDSHEALRAERDRLKAGRVEFVALLPDGQVYGFPSLADADAWSKDQPDGDEIVKAAVRRAALGEQT